MNESDFFKHLPAYLDGQLDVNLRAEVESYLRVHPEAAEFCESERQFNTLVKKASSRIEVPAGLQERLKASWTAQALQSDVPRPHPTGKPGTRAKPALSTRWVVWALSAAALITLAAGIMIFAAHRECPYMVACAMEYEKVRSSPLELTSSDPKQVETWVENKLAIKLPCIPCMQEFGMDLDGAGGAGFERLAQYHPPAGAFVRFSAKNQEPLTLIFHPWKEERPRMMNYDEKEQLWKAVHNGYAVVCWKRGNDQMLCSVVSKRSLEELEKIGLATRQNLPETSSAQARLDQLDIYYLADEPRAYPPPVQTPPAHYAW